MLKLAVCESQRPPVVSLGEFFLQIAGSCLLVGCIPWGSHHMFVAAVREGAQLCESQSEAAPKGDRRGLVRAQATHESRQHRRPRIAFSFPHTPGSTAAWHGCFANDLGSREVTASLRLGDVAVRGRDYRACRGIGCRRCGAGACSCAASATRGAVLGAGAEDRPRRHLS